MVMVDTGIRYEVIEVEAKEMQRAARGGKFAALVNDVLLRLGRTEKGRALKLTFVDEATAVKARTALGKALKDSAVVATAVRSGCVVYVGRK